MSNVSLRDQILMQCDRLLSLLSNYEALLSLSDKMYNAITENRCDEMRNTANQYIRWRCDLDGASEK